MERIAKQTDYTLTPLSRRHLASEALRLEGRSALLPAGLPPCLEQLGVGMLLSSEAPIPILLFLSSAEVRPGSCALDVPGNQCLEENTQVPGIP